MEIISDSSPLISFSSIGEILILKKLFPKIIIPKEVFSETTQDKPGKNDIIKAVENKWIIITPITNETIYKKLINIGLDKGESEAITLAHEKKLSVLLDETDGRQAAKLLKISFTGTIGCLLKAKETNIIPNIKPYLDSMMEKCCFRISKELYFKILNISQEI